MEEFWIHLQVVGFEFQYVQQVDRPWMKPAYAACGCKVAILANWWASPVQLFMHILFSIFSGADDCSKVKLIKLKVFDASTNRAPYVPSSL